MCFSCVCARVHNCVLTLSMLTLTLCKNNQIFKKFSFFDKYAHVLSCSQQAVWPMQASNEDDKQSLTTQPSPPMEVHPIFTCLTLYCIVSLYVAISLSASLYLVSLRRFPVHALRTKLIILFQLCLI